MMQYLFQGFNCRGEEKYKDMLMDIGTEEVGHVEMLCALISQLLDGAKPEDQEQAAKDPVTAAIMGELTRSTCWSAVLADYLVIQMEFHGTALISSQVATF